MEYYIIAPRHDVERHSRGAAPQGESGVDVRVMYDDFGCMYKLPEGYEDTLEAEGIRCCVFNRFIPILSPRFNNRDHRKICVIDGNVGFTGGINFSDAYINVVQRCGHWLDAGVMLRGEGVYALTAMFLSMWDYTRGVTEDFTRYAPDAALCESITAPRLGAAVRRYAARQRAGRRNGVHASHQPRQGLCVYQHPLSHHR